MGPVSCRVWRFNCVYTGSESGVGSECCVRDRKVECGVGMLNTGSESGLPGCGSESCVLGSEFVGRGRRVVFRRGRNVLGRNDSDPMAQFATQCCFGPYFGLLDPVLAQSW